VNDVASNSRSKDIPLYMAAVGPFGGALLGPLLPLLIVFAGTLPPSSPRVGAAFAAAIAGLIALALAVSVIGLATRGIRRFPRELWLPLGALFGTQLIALCLAVDPSAGVFSILCTAGGIVMMVASVEALAYVPLRRAFLACYFVSALGATLFALALAIMRVPPAMFAYEHGRASGTFLQPNEFAGYLLFVVPVGLAQVGAPRWLRLLGLTAAVTGVAGLLFSVSRAAILSLAAGLALFVRRFGTRAVLAYGLAAVIAFLATATVLRNVAHDPSENASRIVVWEGSLRLAQRFALTGVGPFGFHLAYPSFELPSATVDEPHAHSLPLHILIEDGIAGLVGFAWLIVAAIRQAARAGAAIPRSDRERTLLFAALTAGFAAAALQNLIDVVTTFLLIVSWPMLGLLLSLGVSEEAVR
jgi:O-antigen ligase